MNGSNSINTTSLLISSSLVLVALFFSYWQKLKLEKDIITSVTRAVIQLVIVGYILQYIFGIKNPIFTTLLLLFMIFNASYNAAKWSKVIKNGHAAFNDFHFFICCLLSVL